MGSRFAMEIIPRSPLSFLESRRLRCVQSLHLSDPLELAYGPPCPPLDVCLFHFPSIGIG